MKNIPYYTPEVCDGHYCQMDCEAHCPWAEQAMARCYEEENSAYIGMYDIEEIHTDCTVQILKNSITGEVSIGWWENDDKRMVEQGADD